MFVAEIQVLAAALFLVCLYHSWQTEGRKYAQQWFAVGYIFALLRELLLVQLGVILYSDQMLQFGGAPTLVALFLPGVFYVAYTIARSLCDPGDLRRMAYLLFLLTPALMLPLDATGLHFGWWSYPSGSRALSNGVPYFVPLAWGLTGALFYAFIWRVRRIPLRGSGQLFAMVIAVPLIAGLNVVLIALAQVVVNILAFAPGDVLLYAALGLVLLALPLALLFGIPRFERAGE